MRAGPLALVALMVLVLQTGVMPHLKILGGVHPDLILVLTVLTALEAGQGPGWKMGLVLGGAQDLLWGRYIGLFAATRALAGYLSGAVQRRLFRGRVVLPFALCLASTWVAEGGVYGLLTLAGVHMEAQEVFLEVIWPLSLLNAFLGVVVYGPWKWLLQRIIRERRG